jgi:N-methylhydantoinase A
MAAKRSYIIGVDTGGTFTDVVVLADTGEVWTAKASTTPDDFSRGVMDAVGEAAQVMGVDSSDLLGRTTLFKHGSTVATNALITRSGVKVGLITTRGFEDTTEIMRARTVRAPGAGLRRSRAHGLPGQRNCSAQLG